MTPEEYQKKLQNELVGQFLKTFYKKIGYYPIVILNEKNKMPHAKPISLIELESYFDPYLPEIYGVKQSLGSRNRSRPLPELRFIFSYLARSMRYNLKDIARHLGKRDHTTILHGLTTFKNLYQTDEKFKEKYHKIINDIKKKYESSTLDYINQAQDQSQSNLFFGLLQGEDPT